MKRFGVWVLGLARRYGWLLGLGLFLGVLLNVFPEHHLMTLLALLALPMLAAAAVVARYYVRHVLRMAGCCAV